MMQPTPPCPAPTPWWQTWASGLLLSWQLWLGAYSVGFYFLPVMLLSEIPKLPTDLPVREFLLCGKFSSFMTPSPGRVSIPKPFLSLCLLYFILPPFEEKGLPFWVPGVLRQHSEVVLWKLLNIQIIFWWIYGGETGLPSYSSTILRPPPLFPFSKEENQ